jgi:prophage maintenance system killer protein
MITMNVADLVVIAACVLGVDTDAALAALDVTAAEAALTEVGEVVLGEDGPAASVAGAAALLDALIRHHPFRDGNTRVALLAALQFLAVNGWRADLDPPGAARDLVRKLADGEMAAGEVAAWLAPRLSATARPGGPSNEEESMQAWRPGRARRAVAKSLGRRPQGGFERYTDRARRTIVLAQVEARRLHHNYLGTEHLLLGLLGERDGVAARTLDGLGISLDTVRERVLEIIGEGVQEPQAHLPFTPRAKRVLELALRESLQLGHLYVGTEHILLGLVREGDGVAAQVLNGLGASTERVRDETIRVLTGHRETPAATITHEDFAALHGELARLHAEVARLQGLLRQHGIQPDEGTGTQQSA